ncbi:MAG TPA: hypothetical protein VGG61_08700 [Gemmataceae bacterium]
MASSFGQMGNDRRGLFPRGLRRVFPLGALDHGHHGGEATEKYPGLVDPNWRAVTVNHGQPNEWRLGTVAENPSGFAACSAVLGLSIAGFLYCVYRAHDGARRAKLTIGPT